MAKKFCNPIIFRKWYRDIMRSWVRQAGLSAGEITVLLFILDRTLGWGKVWEVIPYRHFTDGVPVKGAMMGGVGMARNAVIRTLARLVKNGMILRHKDEKGCGEYLYSINFEWNSDMLPISKKQHVSVQLPDGLTHSEMGQPPSQNETTPHPEMGLHNSIEKGIDRQPEPVKGCRKQHRSTNKGDTIRGAIEGAQAFNAEATATTRRQTEKPSSLFLCELWVRECASRYPDMGRLVLNKRQQYSLGSVSKVFNTVACKTSFSDFVKWSIANWGLITDLQFWKMKNAPETPEILFFLKCHQQFQTAYMRQEEFEKLGTMTLRERMQYRMEKKGYQPDVIERAVNDHFGDPDALGKELQRVQIQNERGEKAAEIDRENRERRDREIAAAKLRITKKSVKTAPKPIEGDNFDWEK